MTIKDMDKVAKKIVTHDDLLFVMMLSVAFAGLHRTAEITVDHSMLSFFETTNLVVTQWIPPGYYNYGGKYPTCGWWADQLVVHFGTTRTGHSCRVGGAPHLCPSGVSREDLKVMGHWHNHESCDIYACKNPILAVVPLAPPAWDPFTVFQIGSTIPAYKEYAKNLSIEDKVIAMIGPVVH
ncbi:uncharacterized protein MELLADRAFT_113073 [Melampsora larici-populina 98AG31]|uniref:Uncharacterized protein n=1 Tax=Melampsora larici-populina (strain 98AG31 / pathotype 3-4-7) TaxID=747676 RepID=F4S8I4_MELLP|nr:uncharacterized protein MELLADRAFT_113073 [Melampsora larici-populina 98AG31]EGF99033.1 hypothetical protein MELLADRAFT_113073 [Melampsora larici-populina 98AG31]